MDALKAELDEALKDQARAEQRVLNAVLALLRTREDGIQAYVADKLSRSREYVRRLGIRHGIRLRDS